MKVLMNENVFVLNFVSSILIFVTSHICNMLTGRPTMLCSMEKTTLDDTAS